MSGKFVAVTLFTGKYRGKEKYLENYLSGFQKIYFIVLTA